MCKYVLLLLLSFTSIGTKGVLNGQCTGNLGANIFLDGDFGSGRANVLQADPGIAPGFIYRRDPPPPDGFYTITNNTGGTEWRDIYGTWSLFLDNSDDPDGYMMIVNANFSPGKFYEQEVSGLCENTEYQFAADIRNVLRSSVQGLFPDVSFLLDEEVKFSTGDVPKDERWHTYDFAFRTGPGQTSLTLALRNNAPGGDGNDLAIDNITFRACGPEARIAGAASTVEACEGGGPVTLVTDIIGDQFSDPAIQWQTSPDGLTDWQDLPGERANTYETPSLANGRYFYRYLLAAATSNLASDKCRVISNTKIVSVQPNRFSQIDTICEGINYSVGQSIYSASGSYLDTLVSSLGCDSIVSLDLTVVPDPGLMPEFSLVDPSCSYTIDGSVSLLSVSGATEPYVFRLDTFAPARQYAGLAGGTYPYTISDRYGCAAAGAVELDTPAPFIVDLGPDRTVNLGDQARVNVITNYDIVSYEYTPLDIDCLPNCAEVMVLPTETLNLRLTAQSTSACVATDSTTLIVRKLREVFIPNSFSPNGDGVNDAFTIFSESNRIAAIAYLRVFDRWGSMVFEGVNFPANDASVGWRGAVGGRVSPSGTYTYVTEVIYPDAVTRKFSGSLTLLR